MKRIKLGKALLAAVALFLGSGVTESDNAQTEKVDGIKWKFVVENGEAMVGGYDLTFNGDSPDETFDDSRSRAVSESTSGSVTIPSSLGGCPVTRIGGGAFLCCDRLTAVTIPPGVKSLGYQAFAGCRGLTAVTIPSGVTSIGDNAFACCDRLRTVLYLRA